MKTRIATLAILFGLFISATAFSAEPVPASKAVSASVADLIENELSYPEFAIEEKFQGDVALQLVIENDGSFNVELANCVDDDMKKHVITVIEDMESDQFAQYAGQTVLLKVKFDLTLF